MFNKNKLTCLYLELSVQTPHIAILIISILIMNPNPNIVIAQFYCGHVFLPMEAVDQFWSLSSGTQELFVFFKQLQDEKQEEAPSQAGSNFNTPQALW